MATGRSDFANQVNNAVIFPSILKALLDLRAKSLEEDTSLDISDQLQVSWETIA